MPNAEKLFLWKACNDILPTKLNLFRKKVVEDLDCPICLHQVKIIEHALWECESVEYVWGLCSMKLQKRNINNQTFRDLFLSLLDEAEDEVSIEMAVVAWRLWKRRNEVTFQKEFTSPTTILKQANQKLQDIRLLHHKPPVTLEIQRGAAVYSEQWQTPPNDFYKINWDAAIDHKRCRVGIGTIIRN
ncbi:uncharacterized protein LOC122282493 [Carya illinoinensis]|uniref:uncharacterized protein LOC122282493 n=1 Tax=Carya illinoinensis TaxID=32201 RepID=UPI001C71C1CA|nr:uncharacterized protein LOC122282493 [Carya illinoinensis]